MKLKVSNSKLSSEWQCRYLTCKTRAAPRQEQFKKML